MLSSIDNQPSELSNEVTQEKLPEAASEVDIVDDEVVTSAAPPENLKVPIPSDVVVFTADVDVSVVAAELL